MLGIFACSHCVLSLVSLVSAVWWRDLSPVWLPFSLPQCVAVPFALLLTMLEEIGSAQNCLPALYQSHGTCCRWSLTLPVLFLVPCLLQWPRLAPQASRLRTVIMLVWHFSSGYLFLFLSDALLGDGVAFALVMRVCQVKAVLPGYGPTPGQTQTSSKWKM